jgi:hypothetical protein
MSDSYFKNPSISASGLKLIDKSPAHYFNNLLNPSESTEPQKFGTETHCAVLEPAEFDNRYAIVPEGLDFRSKEGKEVKAAIEASGKQAIKYADMQDILAIQKAVQSNPDYAELLKHNPIFEKEFYLYFDGIAVKMKTDMIIEPCDAYPSGLIYDLKSTTDASPAGFAKQMWNMKGYIQAAFYPALFQREYNTAEKPPFIWHPVERSAPYLNALYRAPAHLVEFGYDECVRLLAVYEECTKTGIWPGYPSGITELTLPTWAENVIAGVDDIEINFDDEDAQ